MPGPEELPGTPQQRLIAVFPLAYRGMWQNFGAALDFGDDRFLVRITKSLAMAFLPNFNRIETCRLQRNIQGAKEFSRAII